MLNTKFVIFVCLILLSASSAHAEVNIPGVKEGVHYSTIKPAQPTTAPDGKVEIAELFWYGCPHCFQFEPHVKAWKKNKSDKIVFRRIPAILSPRWESHARVFYAAESMGITDQVHDAFFNVIHQQKKKLLKEDAILDFIEGLGIDRKKFSAAYRSFAVSAKVKQAKKLTQAFNIEGVPSIVINGKYLTSGSQAGSYEGMVVLMNALAETELKSLSTKDSPVKK